MKHKVTPMPGFIWQYSKEFEIMLKETSKEMREIQDRIERIWAKAEEQTDNEVGNEEKGGD